MRQFADLPHDEKCAYIVMQLESCITNLFYSTDSLNSIIIKYKLSLEEIKKLVSFLEKLNNSNCYCCKSIDNICLNNTLSIFPLPQEIDCLIDLALDNAKSQFYY